MPRHFPAPELACPVVAIPCYPRRRCPLIGAQSRAVGMYWNRAAVPAARAASARATRARARARARAVQLRSVGFDQLRSVLEQRDWIPILIDAEWGTHGWTKHFRRDNADVTAKIDVGAISVVTVKRNGQISALQKLDPVTLSEILADLELATTREKKKRDVNAASTSRATSSRARTCV